MIEESIKAVLEEQGDMGFNPLYAHMEQSGLTFKNQLLHMVMGIATYAGIYLDMEKFKQYTDASKYFVILHEMAHGKRIQKLGKKWVIAKMSLDNFDDFANAVFHEEILADRYASYMLFKLTGVSFPRLATQQLHLAYKQEQYKQLIRPLFGHVNNDVEKYDKLFESYLIND